MGLFIFQSGLAQQKIESAEELDALQSIPMEAVFLHLNRTTLLPGEYLMYSVYNINMQTYRFSAISKVAYVQLVDSKGGIQQTQRIRLKQGRGQGDLFIKPELPTGAYKLVAFTNWIRNAGIQQAFQADLNIINPYAVNPEAVSQVIPVQNLGESTNNRQESSNSDLGSGLLLEADSENYEKGYEIGIRVRSTKGALGNGTYSLSVARLEEIPEIPAPSATGFAENYEQKFKRIPNKLGDSVWIPEQREAIISGRILNPNEGIGVSDVQVLVSLPGDDFQLLNGNTNAAGRFSIYMKAPYEGNRAHFDVQGAVDGNSPLQFELDDLTRWKADFGNFQPILIDSSWARAILNRSVHNQIENSYFEAKPDTVSTPPSEESYFGYFPRTYNLDDYTRFNTLQETLVEIIQDVWVKRDKNNVTLWVRAPSDPIDEYYTKDPPIVTLDGVWIQHHKDILNLATRLIKQVLVVQDAIVFGGRQYQGMVSLKSYSGQYFGNASSFPFIPSEPQKRYFIQTHLTKLPHIPDFRHQLYWNPNIILNDKEFNVKFLSSRVPGIYSARLEGFTNYGKPISLQFDFEVQ